ncbi:MAG: DUF2924 domain-containing protein [bacterium]
MGTPSIAVQIQELRSMTLAELREKHLELYGTETRSHHKDQLFKRLAWRIQELKYGGLSDRAKRRAEEIADDLDARFLPPREPRVTTPPRQPSGGTPMKPGTTLTREYRGEIHQVTVLDRGFEYSGRRFRSLSAVAKAITGSIWSGPLFFGLKQRKIS